MTLDDVGFFRQSRHEEIIWMGESDDILIEGADGSVRWRPRGGKGSASYVTAQAARLEVNRTAPLTASPSQPVDVHIFTGKGGVLLLSGVAFDRNGDGMIFGENIGIFPNEKDSQAPGSIQERPENYIPPATFYRLDERSRRASVTGYTTLGELMPPVFANEDAGKDRYVAISSRLVSFLEAFEENLAEKGLDPEKLSVLRGFVSPNERLRLERLGIKLAKYTRFQYGDGIAVVYDPRLKVEDKGTVPPLMGDVNKDDQVSAEDAQFLADIAKETMDDLGIYGGVGVVANYEGPGPNAGTPYLHIDLRGWYVPFRED